MAERRRPHQRQPAEPATTSQVHAIVKGAFSYAPRWKWIEENPAKSATLPEVTAEYADPPDADEAVRLLAADEEHGRVMAVYLWLALVTAARRPVVPPPPARRAARHRQALAVRLTPARLFSPRWLRARRYVRVRSGQLGRVP